MPTVELRYQDAALAVETDPYETVYQAAARSGVPILTDCLEGGCATCKARCLEGDYALIDPSFDALSAEEERDGYVLLCQMEARGRCVVEMPYTAEFAEKADPKPVVGKVALLEQIGEDIVRLGIQTSIPFEFVPGQYAQLTVPGTRIRRAYSFAMQSNEKTAEFYVRLLTDGEMGRYLQRASVGDPIRVESPYGGFYLRPGVGPLVMVSGGTGLAPFLSMLGALARAKSSRSVYLLHGARTPDGLFGEKYLEQLKQAGLDLTIKLAVEVSALENLHPGPVIDFLTPDLVCQPGADIYLCGPPSMVTAAESVLTDLRVPAPRVFAEQFNSA